MTVSVGPSLIHELASYGLADGTLGCYNCGTCSTVCNRDGEGIGPRIIIRYLQLGLKQELVSNKEIWKCTSCGACTENCPRDADPLSIILSLQSWIRDQ